MITLDTKPPIEKFTQKNQSLPASPDKDADIEVAKHIKDTVYSHVKPSPVASKTNSLYGSIDCNMNNDTSSRLSDEGSSCDSEFDGLIYKDLNNSTNTLYMLNVLRKNRQLCDLILQLDDDSQDIYCHQLILACNSKFFMEIFNNYEAENNSKVSKENASEHDIKTETETPKTSNRKQTLTDFVNKNHGANNRQVLFCLSAYLRYFLSDSHHHYAKINSIISNNNHQYQKMPGYTSNHNIDSMTAGTHDEDTINHINQNLDYQALKICIDYMYTSKLKVPSHLLPHVYTLAYHLSIENIVNVCAQYLTQLLNVDNCLGIRSFALDENLIQASSECIEKNIDYILQIRPTTLTSRGSVGSSMNSLLSSSNSKINGYSLSHLEGQDNGKSLPTLSSSLNLANKEFNNLPRIKIELVGIKHHKLKLPESIEILTTLCMNWLVQEVMDNDGDKNYDLCESLNMLYINLDSTLHDCCDMDPTDYNFDDYIDDYQKQHNSMNVNGTNGNSALPKNGVKKQKRKNKKQSTIMSTPSPLTNSRLKTFTITDQELNNIGTATPMKPKVLHDNEVICTTQTGENSFITICTLDGKLVTLSVHLLMKKQQTCSSENDIVSNAESLLSIDSITGENRDLSPLPEIEIFDTYSDQSTNNSISKPPMFAYKRSLSTNSTIEYEKLPRMATARASHGAISYGDKLYIIGGYDRGECLDQCEIYDPVTNTMSPIEPMTYRRGRAAITHFAHENAIYVMGGSDGQNDLNSIEYFDIAENKWICNKFDFELACSNLATASCEKYIYLVGLKGESKKIVKHTSCLKYEPKLNQFTRMSELNQGRSQGALVCTSMNLDSGNTEKTNLIFVFGGHDQIKCLNTCEVYNMEDDKWKPIPSMHEPKRGCGAAVHNNTNSIYIVGGTNGTQSLKSVEIYNVLTHKWTRGPELNIARTNVAIAFIGNVLFAVGGFDGKSFLRTIEYLNTANLEGGWSLFYKQPEFQ